MAAANYDLIIDEGQNLSFTVTWYDKDGNTKDVTDYGALIVFKKEKSVTAPIILKVDHTDYISVGTTNGLFTVSIEGDKTANFPARKGFWQMNIFVNKNEPELTPIRLIAGSFIVDEGLV